MKKVIINVAMLGTILGLVYMAVVLADTSSEKWLCALIAVPVAFGIPYTGGNNDD